MTRSPLAKRLLVSAAIVAALACVCGDRAAALGSASANLTVVVGVNITCTITTSPLVFGNYLAGGINATQPLDATGGVTLNCTTLGGSQRVTLGQGLNPAPGSTNNNPLRRMSQGTSVLDYNLYTTAAYTTVWNNNTGLRTTLTFPQTMTVYGRIPAGQNGASGTYTDAILATITF